MVFGVCGGYLFSPDMVFKIVCEFCGPIRSPGVVSICLFCVVA